MFTREELTGKKFSDYEINKVLVKSGENGIGVAGIADCERVADDFELPENSWVYGNSLTWSLYGIIDGLSVWIGDFNSKEDAEDIRNLITGVWE